MKPVFSYGCKLQLQCCKCKHAAFYEINHRRLPVWEMAVAAPQSYYMSKASRCLSYFYDSGVLSILLLSCFAKNEKNILKFVFCCYIIKMTIA